MRFTDTYIRALPVRSRTYDLREKSGTGFAVRVYPSGRIPWKSWYTRHGRKRHITLGVA